MWLPAKIIQDVDKVARIYYFSSVDTYRWNQSKKPGELRMLTGWCWTERNGKRHGQGYKTITVAYRDCWYALVQQAELPTTTLRVVRVKAA